MLLLALPVAIFPGSPRRAEADDPTWYELHVPVTLEDLEANPTSFKTAKVRFRAILHRIESIFSPFYTPFVPEEYIAFSIWNPDKKLWLKADRLRDFPFCFMRKDNKNLAQVASAKMYTQIEILGTVENDFNNTPWIEVVKAAPVSKLRLTDQSLHHMVMGYDYLGSGQPALAEHEFWEAMKYELPDDAHLAALEELAKIAFEAKRWKEAEDFAHQILNMDEENQLGRDLYRAAREEMVRAYNTGAPHGIEGPSGTDNAHPVNQPDTRGRRSSALPDRPSAPAVAQAEKPGRPPAAEPTLGKAADPRLAIADLERKLGERDRLLAQRSAKLAELEAEAALLRQEKARILEEQAKYTGEVDAVRRQLASLEVEKDKLAGEAAALRERRSESAESLRLEVVALEARKLDTETVLAARDAAAAELERRTAELESCKGELSDLMARREDITREISARKAEVDGLIGKGAELTEELETRRAELERTLARGEGSAREVEAGVRELEARKSELEVLTARAAETSKEDDAVARVLAARKAELEGVLTRRDELTRELAGRVRALDEAKAEAERLVTRRDQLRRETAEAERAATVARRAEEPRTAPEPDLGARLQEAVARQDALVTETARLRREIVTRDATVASLERELEVRSVRIAALEQTLRARDARIAALEADLARTRAQQQRQGALLREISGQVQALEVRILEESRTVQTVPASGAGTAGAESAWRGRRTPEGRRSPRDATR